MGTLKAANLAARFLLELCALAAIAYWPFHRCHGAVKYSLGIGGPLVVAVIWGTFLSPKSPVSLPGPAKLLLEIAVFAVAASALSAAGQHVLAAVLAAAYVVNRVLIAVWDQG